MYDISSFFARVALEYAPPNTCYFMIIIASKRSLVDCMNCCVVLFIGYVLHEHYVLDVHEAAFIIGPSKAASVAKLR